MFIVRIKILILFFIVPVHCDLSWKVLLRHCVLSLRFYRQFLPIACRCVIVAVISNLNIIMNCATCKLAADTNVLNCNGSCGNAFHVTCLSTKNSQYKNSLLQYTNKIPNLRWYCDNCVSVPFDSQTFISTELTKQLTDIKIFVDKLLTSLNSGALTTQSDAASKTGSMINQNEASANGSFATAESEAMEESLSANTSLHGTNGAVPSLSNHVTTRKRQLPASPGASPNSKHQKVADLTQPKSLADMIAKKKPVSTTAPNVMLKTNMVRSIFLTPFNPDTEPSHIIGHLEANDDLKHIVSTVTCKKLARRKNRASFVSFKLDVPRHHYDTFVNPAIWPKNGDDELTVKEFVIKHTNDKLATTGGKNPFVNPANTPSQNQHQRPSNGRNRNGDGQLRKNHGHANVKQQQPEVRNFQYRCQKLCCNRPKPRFNRFHDHYEENHYDHRQTYRR